MMKEALTNERMKHVTMTGSVVKSRNELQFRKAVPLAPVTGGQLLSQAIVCAFVFHHKNLSRLRGD